MVHVCLFSSSVLKPFDKCIIRMQVNEAIFHTFERSWSQPRFVLFKNKTKIGNEKMTIFHMIYGVIFLNCYCILMQRLFSF
jgi:hypothetical protein